MLELLFFNGRLGNCLFQLIFNLLLSEKLRIPFRVPKIDSGFEFLAFPKIREMLEKEIDTGEHTILNTHFGKFVPPEEKVDLFEKPTSGGVSSRMTLDDISNIPNIREKHIVTLGYFEVGYQYLPHREKIKEWLSFPETKPSSFEFFRIQQNSYVKEESGLLLNPQENDLVISLRLDDFAKQFTERLLTFDYFRIILENRKFSNVYIVTNPYSIEDPELKQYILEFSEYNPIVVRCFEPVQAMAFVSRFSNIAISQSTYSWWAAYLSEAKNIYFPIPKTGTFSLVDENFKGIDLRIISPEYKYVEYQTRTILPDDMYTRVNYEESNWS